MKRNLLFFSALACALALPSVSDAYFTTDQEAVRLSDTAAMFTITYAFGLKDEDLYMPIFGMRDLAHNANTGAVGYEFLEDEEDRIEIGEAAGIALSNAEIRNGFYFVPAGEAASFTFVAFLEIPADVSEHDVSLHLTELPFYVGDDKTHRKLNVSELQYYITPEVELNDNKGVRINGNAHGAEHTLETDPLYITN